MRCCPKIEQAYQKAQVIFHDEAELSRIKNLYTQVRETLTKRRNSQRIKNLGIILAELMPVLPNVVIITGWLISIFVLLPMCRVNLDNVGSNASQLLLILDFIAGAVFIPFGLKCSSHLPKLIASFGLVLSIVLLIPLCKINLDIVGTNAFQLILIVDIICSVIIFIRMFKYKNKEENEKSTLNGICFFVAIIAVAIFLIVYGIGSLSVHISLTKSTQSSTINVNSKTNDNKGVYSYEIRNYVGKNAASIGEYSSGFQIDEYGDGKLRIVFVAENGMIIPSEDDNLKNNIQ